MFWPLKLLSLPSQARVSCYLLAERWCARECTLTRVDLRFTSQRPLVHHPKGHLQTSSDGPQHQQASSDGGNCHEQQHPQQRRHGDQGDTIAGAAAPTDLVAAECRLLAAGPKQLLSWRHVLAEAWQSILALFLVYVVTLSLFPGVLAEDIKVSLQHSRHQRCCCAACCTAQSLPACAACVHAPVLYHNGCKIG